MKRGEAVTLALATVIAAVFVKTGAARLPIAASFSLPIPSLAVVAPAADTSAARGATQGAGDDTAGLFRHPPVLVYSERMVAPLLVRAHRPEPRPFLHAGEAIDRELARARDELFRKEFDNLAHLPKSVKRARDLVMNARAGKKVPVSLTQYCLSGTTRRDHEVHEGIVAADPRLFKLGHYVEVYLAGKRLGRFLVDDTGGNVKGATLDIWTPSCSDARRFGRQRGAAILVAKPESAH
jgi:3D (Asp-Asp-Asp) domain-containing protein